jgi:hypothetical protein
MTAAILIPVGVLEAVVAPPLTRHRGLLKARFSDFTVSWQIPWPLEVWISPPKSRGDPGKSRLLPFQHRDPCTWTHLLANHWLHAKFRTSSMLDYEFFFKRATKDFCHSSSPLQTSQNSIHHPILPSSHPHPPPPSFFLCDTPSWLETGCSLSLIRPFNQNDGDTPFPCCMCFTPHSAWLIEWVQYWPLL